MAKLRRNKFQAMVRNTADVPMTLEDPTALANVQVIPGPAKMNPNIIDITKY